MLKSGRDLIGFLDLNNHEYLHTWSRWAIVFGYMLMIYISLPITPDVLAWAMKWFGKKAALGLITTGLLLFLFMVVAILFMRIPKSQWWWAVLPFLGVVGLAYGMDNAVERIHFLEYGLLSYLMYWAARWPRGLKLLAVYVGALLFGFSDEGLQYFLPNRRFDWWDVGLNAMGVTMGLWFWIVLLRQKNAVNG